MVFCNIHLIGICLKSTVTILILIDGFLQCRQDVGIAAIKNCHNPYFNRWFSAIRVRSNFVIQKKIVTILILIDGFLQFRRRSNGRFTVLEVTILILIDGFLQLELELELEELEAVTILILIDGFLQSSLT